MQDVLRVIVSGADLETCGFVAHALLVDASTFYTDRLRHLGITLIILCHRLYRPNIEQFIYS
jgi:hypothetical protein